MEVSQPKVDPLLANLERPGRDFWTWFTSVSGFVFVLLAVVAFVVGGNDLTPANSLETVRSYFIDNRTQVLAAAYLDGLSLAFLLAFAAGLGGLFARSSVDPLGILGRLMLAGAIGTVVITLVEDMAGTALAFRTAQSGDAGAVQALFDFYLMVPVMSFSLAAFLIAAAIGILRGSFLPRIIGWAAFVPAALLVVGVAGLGDPRGTVAAIGFVGGYLPFMLWSLAVCVVLVSRRREIALRAGDSPAQTYSNALQSRS